MLRPTASHIVYTKPLGPIKMNNTQLTSILKQQVEKLPFDRDVDFALNICSRLLPEYISFSQNNNWGNPEILEEVIAYCVKNKSNSRVEKDELKKYINRLEAVTPDTEDFGDWDGSYALNAACSFLELLEYLRTEIKNIF